ncbi:MAG: hypothetical protein IJX07_07525 [Bacillales bacterium]|nr:hypothetical protein [Bacillales bacterium]
MKRLNSDFQTKYISESGTEAVNRDYFGFVELDGYICWAIAEGFDQDSEIKSAQLAVHTVIELFTKKPTMSRFKLRNYIWEAHRQLKKQSTKFQLKASILVVVSDYKKIRYISCGNGRFLIFRGERILLKSREQSIYQKMVDAQQVAPNSDEGLEESRNLIAYLGKERRPKCYISPKKILEDEDILFLATWGFWEKINEAELLDALEDAKTPEEYLDHLQDLYLSKQDGKIHPHTFASVFIYKTFKPDNTKKKKIIKGLIAGLIVLIIIGATFGVTYAISSMKHTKKVNAVAEYEQEGDTYIENSNFERAQQDYAEANKLSKQLTEKKGAKGRLNQNIKENISMKQRITELLVSGYSALEEKDYEKTIEEFTKALKEAKGNMDFYEILPIEEIEQSLQEAKDGQYIYDLSDIADIQVDSGDYASALKNINIAKNLAREKDNRDLEKEMTLKYEEVKAEYQQTKDEKEQEQTDKKTKAADALILTADTFLQTGDYVSAITTYEQAIEAYKELEAYDKAAEINQKIIDAQAKITEEERQSQLSVAQEYTSVADRYLEEQNFNQANVNYNRAKNIYTRLGATEEIKEVNASLERVEELQKEIQNALKLSEISDIVAAAEQYMKDEKYRNAKIKYKEAQVLYQSLNMVDKVLEMKEQISLIESLEKLQTETSTEDT